MPPRFKKPSGGLRSNAIQGLTNKHYEAMAQQKLEFDKVMGDRSHLTVPIPQNLGRSSSTPDLRGETNPGRNSSSQHVPHAGSHSRLRSPSVSERGRSVSPRIWPYPAVSPAYSSGNINTTYQQPNLVYSEVPASIPVDEMSRLTIDPFAHDHQSNHATGHYFIFDTKPPLGGQQHPSYDRRASHQFTEPSTLSPLSIPQFGQYRQVEQFAFIDPVVALCGPLSPQSPPEKYTLSSCLDSPPRSHSSPLHCVPPPNRGEYWQEEVESVPVHLLPAFSVTPSYNNEVLNAFPYYESPVNPPVYHTSRDEVAYTDLDALRLGDRQNDYQSHARMDVKYEVANNQPAEQLSPSHRSGFAAQNDGQLPPVITLTVDFGQQEGEVVLQENLEVMIPTPDWDVEEFLSGMGINIPTRSDLTATFGDVS
uniref:Putative DNA-directed RNA polymerase II subunit RPB1 n=1 Tax=Hypsibius dujardini TaxID=232323 RepID=A0A0U3CF20_HYPDU|nr:putative DNA-directed RNA polymerase II subunit RPB1 [Hypsibius dujardini]